MKSCSAVLLSSLLFLLAPHLSAFPHQPHHFPHVRTIYQFPNETWVENLAVRANGKILVTLINVPEIWEVDPFVSPTTAELIYTFPNAISLLGIAEYAPDVFAVNVGNWSDVTFSATQGSWSVWSLDLRKNTRKAHKITDIPAAKFLNGMTILPANPQVLLVADSGAGKVYRVDTASGEHSVALDVPAMAPNASAPLALGVNGLQFVPGAGDYLYFTNSLKDPAFSRIRVDPSVGSQAGPVEPIATHAEFGEADDFAFDADGNAWITTDPSNSLVKIGMDGSVQVVVGGTGRTKFVGPTACHFGRAGRDAERGTLYIVNNGGIAAPPPRGIVGGSVFAVDTAEHRT